MDDIKDLENFRDLSIYRINSQKLRTLIKDSPTDCYDQIRKHLPILYYELLSELCDELKEYERPLNREPLTVDEFVEN